MSGNYSLSKYERHLDLPGFGDKGQEKLRDSRVCIVGVGGLGSPVALYLAAAGVGEITLIDDDVVSKSNLQRQILFKEAQIGRSKLLSAQASLYETNSETKINLFECRLNEQNAVHALNQGDIIIDCTDNFDTRYLINRIAMRSSKTLVSGSVIYFDGQVAVFKKGKGCYSCLYPVQPQAIEAPTCTESAVLGPIVGVIGTLMSVEVIKELTGIGQSLAGSFLSYSGLESEIIKVRYPINSCCSVCSE